MAGLAGVIALAVTIGMPGAASAQANAGREHFTIVQNGPHGGPVYATGLFNANGTNVEHGNQNGPTGTGTFIFPNGTIVARHTEDPGGSDHFDPVHCVVTFSGTGHYTLLRGTGAYASVSGHGEFTVHGRLGFAHTATGCSHQQVSGVVIVEAHGWTRLG